MTDSNIPQIISREQAIELGLMRYFTSKPCKNGHIAERYVHRNSGKRGGKPVSRSGHCLECLNGSKKRIIAKNPNIFKEMQLRCKLKNPVQSLIRGAKHMASSRGLEFTITKHDMGDMPKICLCCDKEMIVKKNGRPTDTTPTLDRVNNDLGYIPGNVAIICWKCNQMKHKGTAQEHRAIADYMDKFLNK